MSSARLYEQSIKWVTHVKHHLQYNLLFEWYASCLIDGLAGCWVTLLKSICSCQPSLQWLILLGSWVQQHTPDLSQHPSIPCKPATCSNQCLPFGVECLHKRDKKQPYDLFDTNVVFSCVTQEKSLGFLLIQDFFSYPFDMCQTPAPGLMALLLHPADAAHLK